MQLTREQVLSKIKKLLALSQSSNPNEAAVAAFHAQKLMTQYEIDYQKEVEQEEVYNFGEDVIPTEAKTPPIWRRQLLNVIAKANSCVCFQRTENRKVYLFVAGTKSDREITTTLNRKLGFIVVRLMNAHKGNKIAFAEGCVVGISRRINEALNEFSLALFDKKKAELLKWLPELKDGKKKEQSNASSADFYAGFKAGQSVDFGNKKLN